MYRTAYRTPARDSPPVSGGEAEGDLRIEPVSLLDLPHLHPMSTRIEELDSDHLALSVESDVWIERGQRLLSL